MTPHRLLLLAWLAAAPAADDFDLYTSSVLERVGSSDEAPLMDQIRFSDLMRASDVLPDAKGALVVVRTEQGNWAKLVVGQALRKHGEAEVPIAVIHRFQALRSGSENARLAAGRNVYLFDGFRFDLDSGQVVPDDGGGDIGFYREGPGDGALRAAGGAKLYLVKRPLVRGEANAAGPARGPVTSQDFAGKFHLVANGQWSGMLTLRVSKTGDVSGSYVSDQTGRDYPVRGFVATPPHRIRFSVELPMAKQEFDGYLWTRGKTALAGVTTLTERPFGFVAVREGSELMPREE